MDYTGTFAGFTPPPPCEGGTLILAHALFWVMALGSLFLSYKMIKEDVGDFSDHRLRRIGVSVSVFLSYNVVAAVTYITALAVLLQLTPFGTSCEFISPDYVRWFFVPAELVGRLFVEVVDAVNGR